MTDVSTDGSGSDETALNETALAERALFEEFRRSGRRRVRNQIVEEYMGLAIHIAQRYNSGPGRDDVTVVRPWWHSASVLAEVVRSARAALRANP